MGLGYVGRRSRNPLRFGDWWTEMSVQSATSPGCSGINKAEPGTSCGGGQRPGPAERIDDRKPARSKPGWSRGLALAIIAVACTALLTVSLAGCSMLGSTTAPTQPAPVSKTITYEITGRKVQTVSLTWENNTGGSEQGDYKLPFRKTYTMNTGDFAYISAQIIMPTSGAGSIEARIYVDGVEKYYAQASGFPSIASCNGSVE